MFYSYYYTPNIFDLLKHNCLNKKKRMIQKIMNNFTHKSGKPLPKNKSNTEKHKPYTMIHSDRRFQDIQIDIHFHIDCIHQYMMSKKKPMMLNSINKAECKVNRVKVMFLHSSHQGMFTSTYSRGNI